MDGTHPDDIGHEAIANGIAGILNGWSSATDVDLYTNDVTSLIDGTFTGTSGTKDANVTGNVPTGWSLTRNSGDGTITVTASERRSQLLHREAARERLAALLAGAFAPGPRTRRPTRPTKAAVERRLKAKKGRGVTKRLRRSAAQDGD